MRMGQKWGERFRGVVILASVAWSLACGAPETEPPGGPAVAPARGAEPFIEALPQIDPAAATESLPSVPTTGLVPPRFIDYSDPEALVEVIDDLSIEGGPESLALLEEILTTAPEEEIRMDVIDAAAFLADEQDVSMLLARAIEDPSPLVRIEAADLAAEMSLVEVLPLLRRRAAVESDPDAQLVLDQAIDELEWQGQVPVR